MNPEPFQTVWQDDSDKERRDRAINNSKHLPNQNVTFLVKILLDLCCDLEIVALELISSGKKNNHTSVMCFTFQRILNNNNNNNNNKPS